MTASNLATFDPTNSTPAEIRAAQTALGVKVDGAFGPVSKSALAKWRKANGPAAAVHNALASSFADPADLAAFRRCKAQGKSDNACYAVGDNGEGQWGAKTAQDKTPMVALHADDLKATWGSINAGAHKPVVVEINGRTVNATVEDRCGERNRCDCNPAVAKLAGLTPPFLTHCTWRAV